MVTDVVLPQMGLEVTEGMVDRFLVAVGDEVSEGDTVVRGRDRQGDRRGRGAARRHRAAIVVEVGDTVPVGADADRASATHAEDGGRRRRGPDASADSTPPTAVPPWVTPTRGPCPLEAAPPPSIGGGAPAPCPADETASRTSDGPPRRGRPDRPPRRRANSASSLAPLTGTVLGGRITLDDVGARRRARPPPPVPPARRKLPPRERLEPLTPTRQTIARRIAREPAGAPVPAGPRGSTRAWMLAQKARRRAAVPARVGVLDLLVQTLAEALARHPHLAATFVPGEDGRAPRYGAREAIDVGLAVATDRGLLVPVIRRANERTLHELTARALAPDRGPPARGGSSRRDDRRRTTPSNLGTFGIDRFTAMLNPGRARSSPSAARSSPRPPRARPRGRPDPHADPQPRPPRRSRRHRRERPRRPGRSPRRSNAVVDLRARRWCSAVPPGSGRACAEALGAAG